MWNVGRGGDFVYVGQGVDGNSLLSIQFCCELLLKIKAIF